MLRWTGNSIEFLFEILLNCLNVGHLRVCAEKSHDLIYVLSLTSATVWRTDQSKARVETETVDTMFFCKNAGKKIIVDEIEW